MTQSEIRALANVWKFDGTKCMQTFHEISKIEHPHKGGLTHCIENKGVGKKYAIWFDEVMSNWVDMPSLVNQSKPMPHRIDACYVKDENIYLIEFKADGDWERHKDVYWAKFHDCFAQLLDRDILTIQDAQARLFYIVVSSTRIQYSEKDLSEAVSDNDKARMMLSIINPMEDYMQRPWKYSEILPKAGLRQLTAFSCKAVYTLDRMQFERYANEAQWS